LEALGQEGTTPRHIHTLGRAPHACMLGTTCVGPLPPAPHPSLSSAQTGPTRARLPRAYGTVAHHRSARRCFSFSMHVSPPPLLYFWVHSRPLPSPPLPPLVSLSLCVCQYSRKLPCYVRRHSLLCTERRHCFASLSISPKQE